MISFTDGVKVDTSGEWRLLWLKDGWYIVGHGMMWYVNSLEDGEKELQDLREDEDD